MHRHQDGYGLLKIAGKKHYAHRVAYELTHGPIPAGLMVCHRCDNPPCVNPDHLFLATQKGNIQDAVAKDRTAHGRRNGRAKLTESDARFIVAFRKRGATLEYLAHGFDVHPRTIGDLLRGKNWRRATVRQ